jgi:hypothetical protein
MRERMVQAMAAEWFLLSHLEEAVMNTSASETAARALLMFVLTQSTIHHDLTLFDQNSHSFSNNLEAH